VGNVESQDGEIAFKIFHLSFVISHLPLKRGYAEKGKSEGGRFSKCGHD
jgi:hypothetical protein